MRLNCDHSGSSYSLKDQKFTSLEQLVAYYSRQAIPNHLNIPDVFLSKSIPRKGAIQAKVGNDYSDVIISSSSTDVIPDECHHYDAVTNVDARSVTEEDLVRLQLIDRSGELCDCGLAMDETELPRGWSVHLSQDPETRGKAFFVSPGGDSLWDLPLRICLNLSSKQRDLIRRLLCDDAHLAWAPQREDAQQDKQPPPDATAQNCFSDNASGRARGTSGGGGGGAEGALGIGGALGKEASGIEGALEIGGALGKGASGIEGALEIGGALGKGALGIGGALEIGAAGGGCVRSLPTTVHPMSSYC